jgi:membrane-associated protease RseP (regulator of RpoE activity)
VNWLPIILILISAWIIVFYLAVTMLKNHVSPYGPALLIKTQAGVKTIEKVSKLKFWDYFISFFYYAMPVLAVATVILLVYEAILVVSIPKSAAPSLSYALALPGINPAIPVGFGIVGLIVAVALHEASHGIAARRFNIPVRSTGLLWLIIPIGAFVEPDEEEMKKVEPKVRGKIFAAGPGMNVTLAVVFLVLSILLAYSFVPVQGAPVQTSVNPAIHPGDIIQSVDGQTIANVGALSDLSITPGNNVSLSLIRNGHHITESVKYGVYVTALIKNYPAYDAGITAGSIVISVGNHLISNVTAFESVLSLYKAGQSATIETETFNGTNLNKYNITFASKYSYLVASGVSNPNISKDYPFIGVDISLLGLGLFDQFSYLNLLRNPASAGPLGFFVYLGLPFHFELPLPSALLSSFHSNVFSLNAEYLFYWLFWLNFALGLTNILPIVPLDGGYVLLNTPSLQKNKKARDAIVATVSLFVLFLILWEFIIPHI